jgi:hypothetical protein
MRETMRWPTETQSADDRSRSIRCAPGPSGELPAQDTRGATARRGPHRCGIPAKGCESNMRGYQRAVREDGLTIVGSGPAGQIKAADVSARPDCFTVLEKPRGACTPLVHKLLGCRSHGQLLTGGQAKQ